MPHTYKGTQYNLKPLTLGVKAAVIDIFEERNRLVREIEAGIDLNKITNAKKVLERLQEKARQKAELKEDTQAIDKQIELLVESQENNKELQAEIRYYDSQLQTVVLKLIYNIPLMEKVIPVIVDKPLKLDFEDLETEQFIFGVMQDFFFKIGLSSSK